MSPYTQASVGAQKRKHIQGFTLVEFSIVLVIISLIVGGVVVCQDLVRLTEINATIIQVGKFKEAVTTFHGKYGALPGDMNSAAAQKFGFEGRAGTPGQGDGNGLLDGAAGSGSLLQCGGETGMFWSDMTFANGMHLNLVEGSFGGPDSLITPASMPTPNAAQLATCFPAAKIGKNNYFYVYETKGHNYFGLANMTAGSVADGNLKGMPALSAMQAFSIDKKIDDGFPTTGNTQVTYLNNGVISMSNGATTYDASTCYDTAALTYASGAANRNGNGGLCALSFQF